MNNARSPFKVLMRPASRGKWIFLFPNPGGCWQAVYYPHRDDMPSWSAAQLAAVDGFSRGTLIQIASEYELVALEELAKRMPNRVAERIGLWA